MTTYQDNAATIEHEGFRQERQPRAVEIDNVIELNGDVFAANAAIKGNPEDFEKAVHDELVFDLKSTEKREADPEVIAAVERLTHRWIYRIVKRTTDIVFSGVVLILFCWLFAIIVITIKIDDPKGPVFFKQKRMGRTKNGQQTEFEMYKFRSMICGAEDRLAELKEFSEKTGPVFKIKNDPRIDSRIIETNAKRPLSALAFASVFPPKNAVVSAVFSQVDERITYLRNLLENSSKIISASVNANLPISNKRAIRSLVQIVGSGCATAALWAV